MDLIFKDEYDFYVFDTAPTANARRLLGMSKVYSLWVEKMLKSREEAKSLREGSPFHEEQEKDPLMDYLLGFKDRMANAEKLLTDKALTAFFFVTLPESLPIAVITRFINWFYEFGIPVGGVIVNGVIQKEQVNEHTVEFVRNRIAMQDEHMAEIWRHLRRPGEGGRAALRDRGQGRRHAGEDGQVPLRVNPRRHGNNSPAGDPGRLNFRPISCRLSRSPVLRSSLRF